MKTISLIIITLTLFEMFSSKLSYFCSELSIQNDKFLKAECRGYDNKIVTLSYYLNKCVKNSEGNLRWSNDTGNFSTSCSDCSIDEKTYLKCTCRVDKKTTHVTRVNLDDSLEFNRDSGNLECNVSPFAHFDEIYGIEY